ncbi:hypothetical protein [Pseudochryseolinea flava]|uniref:hypothetical protein n=1 Tax=Pseudochryseolinea flava TaxID=2059302 RepID=UPI001057C293|nr:hypothetical protein [Pseudochryseolinea flava]
MKQFHNYLVGLLILIAAGCDSDDDRRAEPDFFPLQKGVFQTYDVEEIVYELGDPDTVHFELLTEVVDSFASDGGYRYIIHRSKRELSETEWTYIDTWSAQKTTHELIVWEENVPFVDLQFPAKEGSEWNGNVYNNVTNPTTGKREDVYAIQETGEDQSGRFTTVLKEDNQEFIVFYDKRVDSYIDNVGLSYREITQLEYCTNNDCLGEQIVNSGKIYKQRIKTYGRH